MLIIGRHTNLVLVKLLKLCPVKMGDGKEKSIGLLLSIHFLHSLHTNILIFSFMNL